MILLLICPVLIASCSKTVDLQYCEELSMKAYKGFPQAITNFKRDCQEYNVKFTAQVCQAALQDLIFMGDVDKVQKKYGKDVIGCFTQNDLKKFKR